MNMINKSVAGGKVNEGRTDSPKQQKVDTETPQQKQAAAKLALRKQLEKTLLQVRLEDLHVYIKLMRFEVPNGIVDNSDSKAVYFDRRFRSDSDFIDEFESLIAICRLKSIYF